MKVLYIAYWGVMEPLGQALLMPQVRRIAAAGTRLTLVTFEKPHHLADRGNLQRHRDELRTAGVRWLPLRYHQRPTVPATAFDFAHGAARAIAASLGSWPDIVHGRTYVGGVIGAFVARMLGRPSIFHNEGFWPDEQVAIGKWSERSLPYRASKRLELELYRRSAAVITLSHPAREIVNQYRLGHSADSLVVVPSCVDLDQFRPKPRRAGQAARLVYTGSLGGRYRIHELARFLRAVRREIPGATTTIYSHSDAEMIRSELRKHGVDDSWWVQEFKPHAEMAEAVAAHDAGLFFLAPGVNAQVCSPTKIGEYWAAGLPVVTTPMVGDVDARVRRDRVGVIVESDTDEACAQAARELRMLLEDPDSPERCRRVAAEVYSLERGVETQLELYRWLARSKTRRAREYAAAPSSVHQTTHAD